MVKRLTKGLGVLVAAALLTTAIAGCGTQNGTSQEAGSTTAAASTEMAETAAPKEKVKLSWMLPTQQATPITESKVFQTMMTKLNVEFDLTELAPDQLAEKKKLLIASKELPDLMSWVSPSEANQYGEEGAFKELTPFLDSKLSNLKSIIDLPQVQKVKYIAFTPDNKLYLAPQYVEKGSPIFDFSYVKEKFDEVGVTKLETWDDVYEAFKLLKAKYPESYPLGGRGKEHPIHNVLALFIQSFTANKGGYTGWSACGTSYDYDKDAYIFGPEDPGHKEAISYLAKLYKEKLMDPEIMTTTMDNQIEKLKQGKIFVIMDYVGGLSGIPDFNEKRLDGKLHPMKLPQAAGVKRVIGTAAANLGNVVTVVNAGISDAKLDRALEVIDYCFSRDFYDTLYNHPDITEQKDGKTVYKADVYSPPTGFNDTYFPWSMRAVFQSNGDERPKPGTPYVEYLNTWLLNAANADMYTPNIFLPFTPDEQKTLSDTVANLNDKYNSQIMLFITGKKPMSDWDKFISDLKASGGDQMTKMHNDAYVKYVKK